MVNFFKKLAGLDHKRSNANQEELNEDDELYTEEEEIELDNNSVEEGGEEEKEEGRWIDEDYEEGQLSIDVYQTPDSIVVKSTIAGVKPEHLDISINNDMLTIRGKREYERKIKEEDYLYKECYWGSFSRSIILPVEVEAEKIEAYLESGVLTVMLPKAKSAKQISIKVKER